MTSTYSARERFGTTLGVTQNNGGPGQIRTADLRFRKPSLYPSELQGQNLFSLPQRPRGPSASLRISAAGSDARSSPQFRKPSLYPSELQGPLKIILPKPFKKLVTRFQMAGLDRAVTIRVGKGQGCKRQRCCAAESRPASRQGQGR